MDGLNGRRWIVHEGDCLDVLRTLPDESVHCCITSPPYWGLRDYGTAKWEDGDPTCDHRQGRSGAGRANGVVDERNQRNRDGVAALTRQICAKCGARRVDSQLGHEAHPEEYVANLVEVFREVRRVLRADGTLWLNLGDSYNGSGGVGGNGKQHTNQGSVDRPDNRAGWSGLKPKDLIGIPWRVAFALQADGWWLRQDIIWAKPNPMPESVTDRCTKAHEYVFVLTKAKRYYYDAEAVKEPFATNPRENYPARARITGRGTQGAASARGRDRDKSGGFPSNGTGRNRRSVWMIATQPYKEAHFATFPPTLIEPMIRAGTSERGCCPECGAPWERVVERTDDPDTTAKGSRFDKGKTGARDGGDRTQPGERYRKRAVGWRPGCSCPDHEPAPCTVLDPFIGSGTTAVVSVQHGRRCIGIELNPEYVKMAEKRIASSAVGVDSAPEHGRISGEQAGEKSLPLPLPFGG